MKLKQLSPLLFVMLMSVFGLVVVQAQDTDPVSTSIVLDGETITVDGDGATADGSTVTITTAGTYNLSGTLANGQIAVDTEDEAKVTLILNGVDIRNSSSAAINIINAGSSTIVLADDTQNFVADGADYIYESADQDEPNAAVFSDDDLTISGSGTLTVAANYNDGIASKDGLTLEGATLNVTSVDDAIRGKNYLHVISGNLSLTTQGDGLKSDNEDDTALGYITIDSGLFNITAGGDAIQAETGVTIADGQFTITSGGGSSTTISEDLSAKGIKAGTSVVINNGTYSLNSADDGVHANGSIVINSGALTIATGDDAIHADASIEINGGTIAITTSYEGIESALITINDGDIRLVSSDDGINIAGDVEGQSTYFLHINGGHIVVDASGDGLDSNGSIDMTAGVVIVHGPTENFNAAVDYDGTFNITGGLLVAAGSSRMAEVPGETSGQNSLLLNFDTQQPAGTLVRIQSSDGLDIVTFAPLKAYQSLSFSSPDLVMGSTYNVYLGGSSDGAASDGLYTSGNYTPGSEYTNFTVSNVVTQIGVRARR